MHFHIPYCIILMRHVSHTHSSMLQLRYLFEIHPSLWVAWCSMSLARTVSFPRRCSAALNSKGAYVRDTTRVHTFDEGRGKRHSSVIDHILGMVYRIASGQRGRGIREV